MRTTTVRKLRPEAWGFICPIHTPDGTPCGLLNHLSASCTVVTELCENTDIQRSVIAIRLNCVGRRAGGLGNYEMNFVGLLDHLILCHDMLLILK